jgi:hypothetical protein
MKITPIPSANIYEFECDLDLLERAFEDFKSYKIEWNEPGIGEPGTFTASGYIDTKNKVAWYHEELFNWMQNCIDQVAEKTLKVPVVTSDSWVTKTMYKQRSIVHLHSWSVFSGVLYFTEHKSSTLRFEYDDHNRARFGNLFLDSKQNHIEYIPTKGKFIIFPSDIFHSIQTHTELKNIRYSLAINTFFNGTVSDDVTTVLQNNIVTVKDRFLQWKAQQDKV